MHCYERTASAWLAMTAQPCSCQAPCSPVPVATIACSRPLHAPAARDLGLRRHGCCPHPPRNRQPPHCQVPIRSPARCPGGINLRGRSPISGRPTRSRCATVSIRSRSSAWATITPTATFRQSAAPAACRLTWRAAWCRQAFAFRLRLPSIRVKSTRVDAASRPGSTKSCGASSISICCTGFRRSQCTSR